MVIFLIIVIYTHPLILVIPILEYPCNHMQVHMEHPYGTKHDTAGKAAIPDSSNIGK